MRHTVTWTVVQHSALSLDFESMAKIVDLDLDLGKPDLGSHAT
jgi:hypothetical protein